MTSALVDAGLGGFAIPADLDTPSVVIDLDVVEHSITAMADAIAGRGLALRPHIKTHKSVEIARRQLEAGAAGLTVGSIGEAEVMAAAGFDDLFIALPVWASGSRATRLRALTERVTMTVGADSVEGMRALGTAVAGTSRRLRVLVEVDSGEERTGVRDAASVARVAAAGAEAGLDVRGAFTHGGHGYASPGAREPAARDECAALEMARDALTAIGMDVETLSAGSTPTATLSAVAPVTEQRPGTYVFGDRQQVGLGSIAPGDVGLMVAATVVSTSLEGWFVIDAGAKVLTRERPAFLDGLAVIPALGGALVERAYDYHGVVRLPAGVPAPAVGTVVGVIPNHVCPVVNLVDQIDVVRAGLRVARWPVDARGCNS